MISVWRQAKMTLKGVMMVKFDNKAYQPQVLNAKVRKGKSLHFAFIYLKKGWPQGQQKPH